MILRGQSSTPLPFTPSRTSPAALGTAAFAGSAHLLAAAAMHPARVVKLERKRFMNLHLHSRASQPLMPPPRAARRALALAGGAVFLAATALLPVAAFAGTCNSKTNACLLETNTSFGPGLEGQSAQGAGVIGTTSNTIPFIGGLVSAGVFGEDLNTRNSNNAFNSGVYGLSTYGYGVQAVSTNNYGLYARSIHNVAIEADSNDTAIAANSNTWGVIGNGIAGGVWGTSYSANGLYGTSTNGYGVSGNSVNNWGVYASSSSSKNAALVGNNLNGPAAFMYSNAFAILASTPSSGVPLLLSDNLGNNLFLVDGRGNVFYHGSLNTFARTVNGGQVSAFTAKTNVPTVEDVGSGQLSSGEATISLDRAFAASIDARHTYHVFITPNGDTSGLYVASKSPTSFLVRETRGGHSSIAFDYRIVASPVGETNARMAFVDARAMAALPHAPLQHADKSLAPSPPPWSSHSRP